MLNNLGGHLYDQYYLTSEKVDLDKAIEVTQQAVDLTPEGHSDLPALLNNLGSHLSDRYYLTSDKVDLDKAIEVTQQAVDLTPKGHSDLPKRLNNLGSHLSDRCSLTNEKADLDRAISLHTQSSSSLIAAITERLRGYKSLLHLLGSRQEWAEGLLVGSRAIQLLPSLAPRSLVPADKQRVLSLVAGLASDTAAMAVHLVKPLEAVQLLEQGRGVLLGDLFDLRSVPPKLEVQHPELAQRFIRIRERLNMPAMSEQLSIPGSRLSPVQQGEVRRQANTEFGHLLQEICKQNGFEDFMQPLDQQEIQSAASRGPIVYINVSKYRCDALIVGKDFIRSVPLDRLTVGGLISRKAELSMSGLQSAALLQWLWDSIAAPIFKDLGLHDSPAVEALPRLWWIPTGLLSHFPLQAAGYHLTATSRSVMDTVVSSFASSIKSIQRSRLTATKVLSEEDRLVLIAMENTPRCSTLPFAKIEAEKVKELCEDKQLEVVEPIHRKELVLRALASCKIFHFAGHGLSHQSDPLQSQLLLDDW